MPRDRSTGMWLYGAAVALAAVLTFEMVYQADAFGGFIPRLAMCG